ncbi:flagellar associated protein [Diplocarpon mali]|nr:flagellar associated protein [Diplocarpon mali]
MDAGFVPTAEERITYETGDVSSPPDLRLLHFNDVYHIDASSAEPVGGIARFKTLCKEYRDGARFQGQPELLTFFSGDAFNPSLESSVTKGSHMVPVLDSIGTDVACVGNHDLDFGVRQFRHLAKQCSFPWLLANVIALGDDVPLGNAQKTAMLTSSNGIKIGVIGLVEREWLDTINSLPPDLIYKSVSAVAKELVPGLRAQGAEIIIAVTHQREPNDNKLAEKTDGLIDIILGGHDHFYRHSVISGTHVLRSGSDFKQLSYIEARRAGAGSQKWNFRIIRRDAVSSIAEDAETLRLTEKLTTSLKAKLGKPLGYTAAPLDARFTTVRLKESNMGNFVCDLMRSHYGGDCGIMAAGTIRGDQIYPPGVLKVRDIMNCFPFEDPCIVIKVSGKAILEALENSVSLYPALEGRFPQVSNIEFEFDAKKPVGSRVNYVKVGGTPLDLDKLYVLVTRGYMGRGKDGFDSLLVRSEGGQAEEIVSEENGILISMMIRQYFMSLKIMGKWKMWGKGMTKHWEGIQRSMHETHPVVEPRRRAGGSAYDVFPLRQRRGPESEEVKVANEAAGVEDTLDESDDEPGTGASRPAGEPGEGPERELQLVRKVIRKWWRLAGLPGAPRCCEDLDVDEFKVDWTKVGRAHPHRCRGRLFLRGSSGPGLLLISSLERAFSIDIDYRFRWLETDDPIAPNCRQKAISACAGAVAAARESAACPLSPGHAHPPTSARGPPTTRPPCIPQRKNATFCLKYPPPTSHVSHLNPYHSGASPSHPIPPHLRSKSPEPPPVESLPGPSPLRPPLPTTTSRPGSRPPTPPARDGCPLLPRRRGGAVPRVLYPRAPHTTAPFAMRQASTGRHSALSYRAPGRRLAVTLPASLDSITCRAAVCGISAGRSRIRDPADPAKRVQKMRGGGTSRGNYHPVFWDARARVLVLVLVRGRTRADLAKTWRSSVAHRTGALDVGRGGRLMRSLDSVRPESLPLPSYEPQPPEPVERAGPENCRPLGTPSTVEGDRQRAGPTKSRAMRDTFILTSGGLGSRGVLKGRGRTGSSSAIIPGSTLPVLLSEASERFPSATGREAQTEIPRQDGLGEMVPKMALLDRYGCVSTLQSLDGHGQ